MRTVGKALSILDVFSDAEPMLALRDISARTGIDKATCHRMLKEMLLHGYVAQQEETRKYLLGATLIRLARTREASVPVGSILQAAIDRLSHETGETCHASLIAGMQIATVAVRDGTRQNRVHVPAGARVAPHATATGAVCLAFGPEALLQHTLQSPLPRYTQTTATTPEALRAMVGRTRARGFGVSDGSFDAECVGVAAPVFGPAGQALGGLAVTTPASRMTEDNLRRTAAAAMRAALLASAAAGGRMPHGFAALISAVEGAAEVKRHETAEVPT